MVSLSDEVEAPSGRIESVGVEVLDVVEQPAVIAAEEREGKGPDVTSMKNFWRKLNGLISFACLFQWTV